MACCRDEHKEAHKGWFYHPKTNDNPLKIKDQESERSQDKREVLGLWKEEGNERSKATI